MDVITDNIEDYIRVFNWYNLSIWMYMNTMIIIIHFNLSGITIIAQPRGALR